MSIKRIQLTRDVGQTPAQTVLDVDSKALAKSTLKAGADYTVIGTVPMRYDPDEVPADAPQPAPQPVTENPKKA